MNLKRKIGLREEETEGRGKIEGKRMEGRGRM